MSDFGFRQTLEVRTLGCARRLRLLLTCTPPPCKDLSYGEEQHKRHRVYTGSGHRCGVIPYSSVVVWWIASWADDEQYKEEQPREGLLLAAAMNCWEELSRLSPSLCVMLNYKVSDPPTQWVASPIYRQRPWASSQILSRKGANNRPF